MSTDDNQYVMTDVYESIVYTTIADGTGGNNTNNNSGSNNANTVSNNDSSTAALSPRGFTIERFLQNGVMVTSASNVGGAPVGPTSSAIMTAVNNDDIKNDDSNVVLTPLQ
jgi:hypothetical protein